MATKWSNSKLFLILVILVGVFFAARYFKSEKVKGNFNPEMIKVDTAAITELRLYPRAANGEEIRFSRVKDEWKVQKGDKIYPAMKGNITSMINTLNSIKPGRLAARSADKWNDFQVSDSTATKIEVFENAEKKLALMIGKFSYKQAANQNPYQQRGISGISYFRLDGQNEVYASDGFLSMIFNRDINSFRDQTFSNLDKKNVKRISYYTPEETFKLEKRDSIWMINNEVIKVERVDQILSKLTFNNQNQFVDNYFASDSLMYSLQIEGDNMDPLVIKAIEKDSANVYMNSSLNKEVWFDVQKQSLFSDIFPKQEVFFTESSN